MSNLGSSSLFSNHSTASFLAPNGNGKQDSKMGSKKMKTVDPNPRPPLGLINENIIPNGQDRGGLKKVNSFSAIFNFKLNSWTPQRGSLAHPFRRGHLNPPNQFLFLLFPLQTIVQTMPFLFSVNLSVILELPLWMEGFSFKYRPLKLTNTTYNAQSTLMMSQKSKNRNRLF